MKKKVLVLIVLLVLLLAPTVSAVMRGKSSSSGGSSSGGGSSSAGGGRGSPTIKIINPSTTPQQFTFFTYDTMRVSVPFGQYQMFISQVSKDKAVMKIGAVTNTLQLGKTSQFDLNKDGTADLHVELVKTDHNKIVVKMALGAGAPAAPLTGNAVQAPSLAESSEESVSAPAYQGSDEEAVPSAASVSPPRAKSTGGISNKLISGVLLAIAILVIFKVWKRHERQIV
jgi:hypothetical protein